MCVPVSGKSTFTRALEKAVNGSVVIASADAWFMKSGEYRFEFRELNKAHHACMSDFLDGLSHGARCVVVDNTNTTKWEYEHYLKVARLAGWPSMVVQMACKTREEVKRIAGRNVHGVPRDKVMQMFERFEEDPCAVLVSDVYYSDPKIERSIAKEVAGHTATVKQEAERSVELTAQARAAEGAPIRYCGIFLDEDSRARLQMAVPPMHQNLYYDHLTVAWKPSQQIIEQLSLQPGTRVDLRVLFEARDSRGQAVAVQPCGEHEDLAISNETPHITLSCAEHVPPSYSNELLVSAKEPVNHLARQTPAGLVVSGLFQYVLEQSGSPGARPLLIAEGVEELLQELDTFTADPARAEMVFPAGLKAPQRAAMHDAAQQRGLHHESTTIDKVRRLRISKPGNHHRARASHSATLHIVE